MAKKQPPFKTEAQEAEWWTKNQDLVSDRFEQAKAKGKLGKGTVVRVARERALKLERRLRSRSGWRKMTSPGLEPSPPRKDCCTRPTSKCCDTKL
jgi:hypothetical protein